MSAGAILNTFGRGTVLASEYCLPTIKLSRLLSWKAFRALYDGGHYSLRGDIIHGGTVFTPTTVLGRVCVCVSVCLKSHISLLERLLILKILSRTQRSKEVKIFVGFSLKPLRSRVMA